ncbi:late competence development ComFB family protein [Bacillus sp. NPDC093026]|uniref:late competence development ComFB family protein n=1 Tax=Bacillus sp. NPDC093026 TaxID=3363948 RepID=UPI00382688D7
MLFNAKEIRLKESLYQYLNQLNMICHCEKCLEDVLAISLNQVKPQYITDIDKISYSKSEMVDKQKNTTILAILIGAVSKVTAYPRCAIQRAANRERLIDLSNL